GDSTSEGDWRHPALGQCSGFRPAVLLDLRFQHRRRERLHSAAYRPSAPHHRTRSHQLIEAVHGADSVRTLVLLSLAMVLGLVGASLARHPAALHDPAAPVYGAMVAVTAAGYVAAAFLAARRPAPLGLLIGAIVSLFWAVELWAGNLAPPGLITV